MEVTKMHDRLVMSSILVYLSKTELLQMQLVCRLWYDDKVPEAMDTCLSELGITNKLLAKLLTIDPDEKNETPAYKMWRKMKPLTIE